MGRLMRKHGLACDNLESVQIVSTHGKLLQAGARENPDLFWGVRGGGGNFGVVTQFEYRLHPLQQQVIDGARIYPYAQARALLEIVGELSERCPDDLLLATELLNFPPGAERSGRVALVAMTLFRRSCGAGAAAGAVGQAGDACDGPADRQELPGSPGRAGHRTTGSGPQRDARGPSVHQAGFLHSSSTVFNDEIVRRFEALPPELDAVVLVAQMGGAVSRVSQDATAFWTRKATHDLMPGADDKRVRATYGDNYARLQQLKNKYDPGNLFRMNANIKPA
jgi:FAD/FMN-containing dehydrogenase